ncbi:hypothetical protein GIB67_019836 [Kingdonia uniflora]|uniref:DUF8039 domain-containing protein n=1 Tax=Kingdonia uniflora TaxID=39325 RepID=A0A7J7MKK2_9MAGN|nr:hypothetical protein GIB67_019836 [Kingdonia uniflora]
MLGRDTKSRLNKMYIKGKDPTKAKATPPPFVPKEVWMEFVDMCNSDAFQAVKKNVPNEDGGRADVFIKAHTKADNTYQCPEIIEKLQENMNLYPDSNKIGHDDVLAKTLGKDKKGHMMAMGIDITPSFVANAIHIVEENEDLKATNNELKTMLLNMRKDLDDHIKKKSRKQSDLNREYKLNGCLEGMVAYGIVADVSPDAFCHNKQLGDGYYKIEIFNVINEDALLFRQDSFTKTIGDVGAGSFVAWPKYFIIFTS